MSNLLQELSQKLTIMARHPLYVKYNLIIIPAICILFALLIFIFLTLPQVFKLIDNNAQLTGIQQSQKLDKEKIQALESIDLEAYKNGLNQTLIRLPSDKDIPGAISSILDVLSNSGLKLENFTLASTAASGINSDSFAVKIEVSGSLDQLKNLITTPDQSERLLKIVGISLNNSQGTSVQASLDILVFYMPLDTNVTTSASQKNDPLNDSEQKLLTQIEGGIKIQIPTTTEAPLIDVSSGKSDPFN